MNWRAILQDSDGSTTVHVVPMPDWHVGYLSKGRLTVIFALSIYATCNDLSRFRRVPS